MGDGEWRKGRGEVGGWGVERGEGRDGEREGEKNKYFELKKLVGRRGAPELELLAVVIVLFAPILHESLTNSNFVTNTI